VPRIEGVGTELEACAARFADQEALEQREIPVITTGASEGVKAEITPGSRGGGCERSRIYPLNTGHNSVAGYWRFGIRNRSRHVGPVSYIAAARENTGH